MSYETPIRQNPSLQTLSLANQIGLLEWVATKSMTERPQRPPILKPDEFYTFRSYFQMKFAPADILRELGASLTKASLNLPPTSVQLTRAAK